MEEVRKEVEETTEKIVEENNTKHNTFTQEDVNNVVARNVKEERAKILKELGVEDFENVKEAVSKVREQQDAQESELEKVMEENERLKNQTQTLLEKQKNSLVQSSVKDVLTEAGVDLNKTNLISKLVNADEFFKEDELDADKFKNEVLKTIEEQLPELIKPKKMGVEGKEDKVESSTAQYLKDKYKDNKYFKL